MVAQDSLIGKGQDVYVAPPPLTHDEEDALIHTRLTNDERLLRRVTRKYHTYSSLVYPTVHELVDPAQAEAAINEAREAFLVELASFQLLLNKSAQVCEAEKRQVVEYEKERERIINEQAVLREQIVKLKVELEDAQVFRKRKLEYDQVAEKVNLFPPRDELEESISSLESEIQSIQATREAEESLMAARRAAFDSIVAELESLRLMGKESEVEEAETLEEEPAKPRIRTSRSPEDGDGERDSRLAHAALLDMEDDAGNEHRESGRSFDEHEVEGRGDLAAGDDEAKDSSDDEVPLASTLNPLARPFRPGTHIISAVSTRASSLVRTRTSSPSSPPHSPSKAEDPDADIEMGEVEEPPKYSPGKSKRNEELEEGEASDVSELTQLSEDEQ